MQTVGVVKIADFGAPPQLLMPQACTCHYEHCAVKLVPLCSGGFLSRDCHCTGLSKTLAIQSNVSRSGAMGELDARGEPLNSERCAPCRLSVQTGVLITWFTQ